MALSTVHTADGFVIPDNEQGTVFSVVLAAGADDATAILRDGGASGTKRIQLAALAGTTATWTSGANGVLFSDGAHLDVSGTTPAVTVERL